MRNYNILLVDSCKTDIEYTKNAFSVLDIKHTLYTAETEIQAWAMLQGNNKLTPLPEILIIDINEEGINGIDLLRKIRIHPDLKSILVFVITAADNEENRIAAINLNIAGYFRKPIEKKNFPDFFSILNDYWNLVEFPSKK
ncbi:response regulator [Flavobacterium caseinilyticum]|uniref:Response regulator n=1 Tax=Flavobacterium caseinilyticum TaxID=2541732 RepID=A0A4V2YUH1_9FLAO|nr:response regulator [Flavobacterium caseinilyticum]TDD76967.1 response regulator [Flavobacterium caseinilyticum]